MSNHLAIATVTAALSQVLRSAAVAAVDEADVTMSRPDDPPTSIDSPRVNLYLYHVAPNPSWRNADLPARRSDGGLVQRPCAALDLHYLLTFYGDDTKLVQQRLLGSVVSMMHSQPVLTRARVAALVAAAQEPENDFHYLRNSDLAGQVDVVRFSPLPLSIEELSKLWSLFFQVSHAISIAYQGSVVLIESDEIPGTPLPVLRRKVYVVPFQFPTIERAVSLAGDDQPIFADSTLVLIGRELRGGVTRVKVAGELVDEQDLEEISGTRIGLSLALPQLTGELRAGVQGVQVVQPRMMGEPEVEHSGVESNVAAFVLRPTVTLDAPDVTSQETVTEGGETITLSSGTIGVTFSPQVGREQRVVLLLNELTTGKPRFYSFKAPERSGDAPVDTISIPFERVKVATYLARLQVDGAESLNVDADGVISNHQVTIP